MRLVVVNHAFDAALRRPEALLDEYRALTGWCEAAATAGLDVRVVQRFARSAERWRGEVGYYLRESRPGAMVPHRLHETVARAQPDVVHVNGLDAPLQAWLLRRRLPASVPVLVQDHAGAPSARGSLAGLVRRPLMRAIDGYLFTAREQAAPWLERGFIRGADAVHEVLTASTTLAPVPRDEARASTGMRGTPALLWVARLDPNKDPLTVVAAFERALDALPDASLTMVCRGGALADAVRARVATSASLRARVRLVGAVPHGALAAWYSAADLFVVGSAHEVCGFAVVEACACGAVPVVTDIAPFRAITGNGAIGRLWRRGDADALCAALIEVAQRDRERQRAAVLAHFARHLSWTATARRARAVYEAAVRRAARGRPTGA
jgi:glycosyltransferase involved in cell wall biosynthesis